MGGISLNKFCFAGEMLPLQLLKGGILHETDYRYKQ